MKTHQLDAFVVAPEKLTEPTPKGQEMRTPAEIQMTRLEQTLYQFQFHRIMAWNTNSPETELFQDYSEKTYVSLVKLEDKIEVHVQGEDMCGVMDKLAGVYKKDFHFVQH